MPTKKPTKLKFSPKFTIYTIVENILKPKICKFFI